MLKQRTESDRIVIGGMDLIANKTVPSLSVRAEIIEEEGVFKENSSC